MASLETAKKNLEALGYSVQYFATGAEAAEYLNGKIDGCSVGFGGSMTLKEIGLDTLLATHNELHWHWTDGPEARKLAKDTQVYICSANGLAETGEIVNIDGMGNRVASQLYGHEKLYLVIGRNKLADDYDGALWRARNIAAPRNAYRLKPKTPCAVKGDRCYNCKSPERICRGLVVQWRPMTGTETEIILVDEDLGM